MIDIIFDEEGDFIVYFASLIGPTPSDCEWLIPGTQMEDWD